MLKTAYQEGAVDADFGLPYMLSAGKETIQERTMIIEPWGNVGLRKGDYKLWSDIGREHSPDWDSLVAELKRTDLRGCSTQFLQFVQLQLAVAV